MVINSSSFRASDQRIQPRKSLLSYLGRALQSHTLFCFGLVPKVKNLKRQLAYSRDPTPHDMCYSRKKRRLYSQVTFSVLSVST
jgi:hypothetical protein